MNPEGTLRDGRDWIFAIIRPGYYVSLALVGLLFLPAELRAAACTNPNPNPNPNPATFAAPHDFDGDCKSDILWRNNSTQQVLVWLMNGTARGTTGSPGSLASAWSIQGVGDFDGDGKSDILWRNSTSGQVFVWLMNGTARGTTGSPGSLASAWSIQGVGDFDGDGKSDILWRNDTTGAIIVWLMNGTALGASGSPGNLGAAWSIQGVGDFDGDGKSDILWRNSTTGQVFVWLMNGTSRGTSGSPGNLPAAWSVQGVGDFNGDGKSDILWRNDATGQVVIWPMNGTTRGTSGSPGAPAVAWTIQGVGDFDGDGKADILWRNDTTGAVVVWLMNGAARGSSGSPGGPAVAWQISPLSPYTCPDAVLCAILSASNNLRASGPFGTGNPAPSATTGGALLPFAWSASAATVARNYAAQCNFAHNPSIAGIFGENIYAAGSTTTPVTLTGSDVVSDWAAEVSNYDYNSNSCAMGETCGHYTQLVWRNTTAVGCAVQQCTTNSPFGTSFPDWAFAVCDFSPPGNFDTLPY